MLSLLVMGWKYWYVVLDCTLPRLKDKLVSPHICRLLIPNFIGKKESGPKYDGFQLGVPTLAILGLLTFSSIKCNLV